MVKASAKASTKTSTKTKKQKSTASLPEGQHGSLKSKISVLTEEDLTNSAEITIDIQSYQNIPPSYPSSYLLTKCQYMGKCIGESTKLLLTDDSILMSDHKFIIRCNIDSPNGLDKLVTNPVILQVFQLPNTNSRLLESEHKLDIEKVILDESLSSIESAISLYEALTGDVVEKVDIIASPSRKKNKGKSKKKSKDKLSKSSKGSRQSKEKVKKKSSKDSKKSKSSSKASSRKEHSKEKLPKAKDDSLKSETETGACVIDLLPLIYGNSTFTEFLPLIVPHTFCDDRMARYSHKPGISVMVSIDKPVEFSCTPVLANITLESIYNIPTLMNNEMEYQVCVVMPSVNLPQKPVLFKNGTYTEVALQKEYKQWSEIPKDNYFNKTAYKVESDSSSVKNYVDNVKNIEEATNEKKPMIEFNCIKRNIFLKEGFFLLYDHIRKHRRIVIEFYVFKKQTETKKETKPKVKNKTGTSSSTIDEVKKEKPTSYLHLMAVVDLSSLIFPGVTKLRLATPLTTFHHKEALLYGGLKDSYFFPSPKLEPAVLHKNESKLKAPKKDKKSKSDKSSAKSKGSKKTKESKKSKGSKKSKEKKDKKHPKEELNLNDVLPSEPPHEAPPEPSKKVYNEKGQPTFIVLEIELTQPLVEKTSVSDLHGSLKELVHVKPEVSKIMLNNQLDKTLYKKIVKEVILKINETYSTYIEKKNQCHCSNQADFLTYIKRSGLYQNLIFTIGHVACLIAQFKLNKIEKVQSIHEYHNFLEQIFIWLMNEVNHVLNEMTIIGRHVKDFPESSLKDLLFYAKEAEEIRNSALAEHYYLKRLQYSPKNPDPWFEFAIYKVAKGHYESALMCLQEALSRKLYHRNSLLLTGVLLAETKRFKEAEMCLLTLMVQESRWTEGWAVLYLFYKEIDNSGGMDLSKEMVLKYMEDPRSPIDDFMKNGDLVWTSEICPNTLYFKASVILLKMRVYSWVENALACELKEPGVVHYLLAVICYYKRNYQHALEHLERARFFHGSDCAVLSLTGHCYFAIGKQQEAYEEYSHILESFQRPDDIHLVYLNCAKVAPNAQEAKKLLLTACKHRPTPYTWMACGIAYLKLKDFMSAEECFSESVFLDNSRADAWGYLTLANLKMRRLNEAETCYALALKNDLKDQYLLDEIKNGFEQLKSK